MEQNIAIKTKVAFFQMLPENRHNYFSANKNIRYEPMVQREELNFPKFLPVNRKPFKNAHHTYYHVETTSIYRYVNFHSKANDAEPATNVNTDLEFPDDLLLPDLASLDKVK